MRIRFQKHAVEGRAPLLDKLYADHLAKVSDPTTEIEIRTLPPRLYSTELPEDLVGYGKIGLLFADYFARTAVAAERDGCAAWITGAGQDPGLAAARVRTTIPVVGYGEATWQLARQERHRLGLIGFIPHLVEPITDNIAAAGAALASYDVVEDGPALVSRALAGDFGPFVAAYTAAAERAAAAGAQWLVPAEGIPNELLVHLEIRELCGLPVVDPGGLAVKTAEHLVKLRALGITAEATTGYWHRQPSPDLMAHIAQILECEV
ncbi:aspartate/glutamate racemase family protein [Nocardia blacklockiae]|uniref:aspartate/glutamate racemase family protein n=1 Tax=Nocardia blacklockiae TaxID=480036 RepID=UPI001893B30A|nr:aspartate/glutamate racemase family protein [Nocardia blacklockiae]MBF6170406.1 hydantoin racemase [Nocardia blacklockiae]